VALRNAMAAGNINISGQGMIEHISSFLPCIDRDLHRGCCDQALRRWSYPKKAKLRWLARYSVAAAAPYAVLLRSVKLCPAQRELMRTLEAEKRARLITVPTNDQQGTV